MTETPTPTDQPMTPTDATHDAEAQTTDAPSRGHDGRAYCVGCGKDMWEYTDAAKEDGWCLSCAPECYAGGVHVAARGN